MKEKKTFNGPPARKKCSWARKTKKDDRNCSWNFVRRIAFLPEYADGEKVQHTGVKKGFLFLFPHLSVIHTPTVQKGVLYPAYHTYLPYSIHVLQIHFYVFVSYTILRRGLDCTQTFCAHKTEQNCERSRVNVAAFIVSKVFPFLQGLEGWDGLLKSACMSTKFLNQFYTHRKTFGSNNWV